MTKYIGKKRTLKIDWLGECPKCSHTTHEVTTSKGSEDQLFDGDQVKCWCGQTGEIDTHDGNAWVEWGEVVISDKDHHDSYYRNKYPDYWCRLPACNHQAWEHYEVSLHAWLVALKQNKEKLEGCVVVPKDQIEVWWQDAEEPENFATQSKDLHFIADGLEDGDIMKIHEHHTIHMPSNTLYGAWIYKDGERSFVTGSLEECCALLEAARGGSHE